TSGTNRRASTSDSGVKRSSAAARYSASGGYAKGIPPPLYDVLAGSPNRAASMSRAMTKKSPPSLSGNGEAKMKLARTMNATASAEATSTAYVRRETSPASAAEPVGVGAPTRRQPASANRPPRRAGQTPPSADCGRSPEATAKKPLTDCQETPTARLDSADIEADGTAATTHARARERHGRAPGAVSRRRTSEGRAAPREGPSLSARQPSGRANHPSARGKKAC